MWLDTKSMYGCARSNSIVKQNMIFLCKDKWKLNHKFHSSIPYFIHSLFYSTYGRKTTIPPFAWIMSTTAEEEWMLQLSKTMIEFSSPLANEPTCGSTKCSIANSKFLLSYAPSIAWAAFIPLEETATSTLYRVPRVYCPLLHSLVFTRLRPNFL